MNKFQILVVEDDSPIRNLIATTLKTHNYKYLLAQNGEEILYRHQRMILMWSFWIWGSLIWMELKL